MRVDGMNPATLAVLKEMALREDQAYWKEREEFWVNMEVLLETLSKK